MNTLMHICCAPCSYMCIETLRSENINITGFWYNPNIHPFQEYKARRDTLIMHAKNVNMPLVTVDDYAAPFPGFTCRSSNSSM